MPTFSPFARPLYVMAKPSGSLCNLHCDYCYYLEKRLLYAHSPSPLLMDDNTLETFIRQYIEAQTQPQVLFTWHGGEPLMRPLSFYRRVVELQRKHARGHYIDNCLQTNGTLLNDDWCAFFREHNWLIGISIDGPQEMHDGYRRSGRRLLAMQSLEASPTTVPGPQSLEASPTTLPGPQSLEASPTTGGGRRGGATFDQVLRGIRLLQKHGVEWNAMGVVNDCTAAHPLDVYHCYKDIGCQYIQFAPVVERLQHHEDGRHLASPSFLTTGPQHAQAATAPNDQTAILAPYSVSPGQYGRFCCAIFDEWVRHDVGRVFVQLFDSTLACWAGVEPGVCTMCATCGHAAVIEANGDLYSCDHFVFPEYRLGNIHHASITSMMYSPRQLRFGRSKRDALPRQCRECRWLFACHGGCPKDRFCRAADGEPGLNYFCEDFRLFFAHVAPYMDFMKNELDHQRPPANIMQSALLPRG